MRLTTAHNLQNVEYVNMNHLISHQTSSPTAAEGRKWRVDTFAALSPPCIAANRFHSCKIRKYKNIHPHILSNMTIELCLGAAIEGPPVAERIERLSTVHDKVDWNDPYYYMREEDNEKVMDYLRAENTYVEAQMASTKKLQEDLYKEMRGRIRETDSSVPARDGEWYYYTRTLEGKQYGVYCRKKDDPDIGREEVLLDLNQLAEGKEFLSLGAFEVSPDGNVLAYSLDETGDEDHRLYFKDLRTGKITETDIVGTDESMEWCNDNKTVFFTKIDDTHRPYQVYRLEFGPKIGKPVLVFEETDKSFYVSVSKTFDRKYITISSGATTTEIRFIDAHAADVKALEFKIFATRRQGVEYSLTHHKATWFITTNADGAKNFKLMSVPVARWKLDDFSNWEEVLAHRADVKLDRITCFERYMAIWERVNGFKNLRIKNLMTNHIQTIDWPEESRAVYPSVNYENDATVLRVTYTSFITPRVTIDYNMLDGTRIIRKEEAVQGYDPRAYKSAREMVLSRDGTTQIPVSILYKVSTSSGKKPNDAPLVLYGYGSYGVSIDPRFDSDVISLLDRGVVYAVAHIRGGGEFGRPWYEAGKLEHKKNTFFDYIDVAKHLIARKYTTADKLAGWGASAGGLLMGAVNHLSPELFRALIADVPFVDVMNTMLDPELPLVVNEYEEWGNPTDSKKDFHYMLSYSPYDNLKPGVKYPAILATGGVHDPRVKYWEPAKWVAKLRHVTSDTTSASSATEAKKTNNRLILLKTEMGQGHMGPSGRFDALKDTAFRYAFLLKELGVDGL